jgi:Mg2+/Co2+ transporter CorB
LEHFNTEPFFIPENKKLDNLLKDFQRMKSHLAIVVDEYGELLV